MSLDKFHKLLSNFFIEGGCIRSIGFRSRADMGLSMMDVDVVYNIDSYNRFCNILGVRDLSYLASQDFLQSKLNKRLGHTYISIDSLGIRKIRTDYNFSSDGGGDISLSVEFCGPDEKTLLQKIANISNEIQWLAMNQIIDQEIIGDDNVPPPQISLVSNDIQVAVEEPIYKKKKG